MQLDETHPNQSAFPSTRDTQTWGLTKREYFASQALAGLLANPKIYYSDDVDLREMASSAVVAADVLIEELNYQPTEK